MRAGTVVVDTSFLVDLLLGQTGAGDPRVAGASWHAPAHLDVEVLSALRGLVRGGHVSVSRALDALVDLDDLDITRWPPDDPTRRRVFALRERMTAHDAAFVACAEGLEATLVTRDRRLAAAAGQLVEVVLA